MEQTSQKQSETDDQHANSDESHQPPSQTLKSLLAEKQREEEELREITRKHSKSDLKNQ